MRNQILTLKTSRKVRIPPRADTLARLPDAAENLRRMQAAPAVVLVQDPALVARVAELERQLAARAHREERVKAVTIRVVDRRAAWESKMGLRQRQPLVALTSQRIVTADSWEPQTSEE